MLAGEHFAHERVVAVHVAAGTGACASRSPRSPSGSGPLLAASAERFARIELDVWVTDEEFDIVAAGYDAGVRLGEAIARDMVAVPVSADQRQLAVAAPSYLDWKRTPDHPRELTDHCWIGWRPAPGVAPYRWEFEENGREFQDDPRRLRLLPVRPEPPEPGAEAARAGRACQATPLKKLVGSPGHCRACFVIRHLIQHPFAGAKLECHP